MSDSAADHAALALRIRELEILLRDSEDTLDAIRRGEVDALVVGGLAEEQQVYTLQSADRPYRVLIEQIQEGAVTLAADGTVLYCNRRLAGMLGLPQERVIGTSLRRLVLDTELVRFDRLLADAGCGGARGELTFRASDATLLPAYMSLSPLRSDDGATLLCGVLTDLTGQKLHLRELALANERLVEEIAERERIEDALRQSQKMEAVGQLTGGLAHDFNNLLTGVIGSLELLQTRIAQGRVNELDRYVDAAQGAANRAASLTHRLLAFSRRQTLDPRSTEVNRLVAGLEELLRRTVGPAIAVETVLADGLGRTRVDTSQLENALLNLCINARDAMPSGGRLVIETADRTLDERSAREHELPPGDYVTLSVVDDGTGMPPDVISRVFDPFFTTKPIGQGTGLGLSMVYGFVRQSGGQVRIASEVGRGTSVRLYLPRHRGEEAVENEMAPPAEVLRAGCDEVVLVVDDEPTVRMLVTEVLQDLGYVTIEAADGPAGLRVLQAGGRIDLLVTDVGLPGGMNGRQLADAARVLRPGLGVLFITGYAEAAVLGDGYLDPGMHVLPKPFGLDVLASRIKALIAGA